MDFSLKKIAILGATSHIAKGLICNFLKANQYQLVLFARSPEKVVTFLKNHKLNNEVTIKGFDEFGSENYDVVINCVGIGNPIKLLDKSIDVFRLTEYFDNLIIEYILEHRNSIYINFSSGAVYGNIFNNPAHELSLTSIDVNNISSEQHYCIAKINSEAKHRALQDLNIIDLRVFGYYSRFIDLNTKYFLTEVITCIKSGQELLTGSVNIVRDYIHPLDLFSLIQKLINIHHYNGALDVLSQKPITKFEILDYFHTCYNLKYQIEENYISVSATGNKDNYYSINKKALQIGYNPVFTSFDTIAQESKDLLDVESP